MKFARACKQAKRTQNISDEMSGEMLAMETTQDKNQGLGLYAILRHRISSYIITSVAQKEVPAGVHFRNVKEITIIIKIL